MIKKVVLLGLILLLGWTMTALAKAPRVAVTPFAVYAQEDLAFLADGAGEMMSGQLQQKGMEVLPLAEVKKALGGRKQIDEAQARVLARTLKADYVVYGSLTKVGNQISLDARLVDAAGTQRTVSAFNQVEGADKLSLGMEKLAQDLTGGVVAAGSSPATGAGGTRVAKVLIEGNKRIETDAIKRALQTQPGEVFSETKVSEDLRRVYDMNFFEDVKIDVSDSPAGKVVKFVVDEKPAIVQVDFSGNFMLERDTLMGALGYNLYAILDPKKMADSIENLRKTYRDKGYYSAQISYSTEGIGPKTVAVKYQIAEGGRKYIQDIEFRGNKDFSNRELRAVMQTKTRWMFSFLTDSGILKQDDLKDDLTRLTGFYLKNGYIRCRVGDPEIKELEDGLEVTIPIEEGAQYRVGHISVTGDLIMPEEDLLKKLKLGREKIYNQEVATKDLDALKVLYADYGYAYNQITPKLADDPGTNTVNVTYNVEKKHLVTFERIDIVGNDKTRDKVIRRELKIREGELFSGQGMRKSRANLQRLNYFDNVEFNTSDGSSEDKMNVRVELKEKPTGAFSIGAGYSSYNQVFGVIRVSQDNLFGTGRKLSIQASMGGRSDEYVASFTEPWLFDTPLTAGADVFYKTDRLYLYSKKTSGFALRAGYPIWEDVRLSGRYTYQNVDIYDINTSAASVIQQMYGWTTSSGVSMQLRRDTRDKLFNPTEGSDNSVTISYFGGPLSGDSHFTEYTVDSGWFIPTFWDNYTLFVRGKAGLLTENKSGGLPLYEKYYLGGMNSVRGYKPWSIAPTDPATGDTIGGEKMALFNAEFIFPLLKDTGIMGVIFYDQGGVYAASDSWRLGEMQRSYGGGFRYYSPLGPLRLEWGKAINPRPGDPQGQWEFSVGTFF